MSDFGDGSFGDGDLADAKPMPGVSSSRKGGNRKSRDRRSDRDIEEWLAKNAAAGSDDAEFQETTVRRSGIVMAGVAVLILTTVFMLVFAVLVVLQ